VVDFLLFVVAAVAVIWIATRVFLRGPDLSEFDEPRIATVAGRSEASPENAAVILGLKAMANEVQAGPRRDQMTALRRIMDQGLLGAPVTADQLNVRIDAVDAGGVAAEWVLAPGADPSRRLLYLHGGGFFVGSPRSARMLTAALSRSCGVAVLAIDYRLMPENRRIDTILDSQAGYRWMLDNGPAGAGPASEVYVAGDSAGGNLALMLSAWTRDEGVRRMDAVIALSPSTDSTLANPSFRNNVASDAMLGPSLGLIAKIPATLKALLALVAGRLNPSNPIVSPLFGELGDLPPTLVHASDCEMLHDDAHRYVNRARSQGSPVEMQIWPGMVHVFQMLGHMLPEANEAMDEIARFVARTSGQGANAPAAVGTAAV